jgi:hypothetical protein
MQIRHAHKVLRGLGVGGVAMVTALPTSAAFGQTLDHSDPAHDVVEPLVERQAGSPQILPAPQNKVADIVQVRFVHTSRRVVATTEVQRYGNRGWEYLGLIKTPTATYVVDGDGRQDSTYFQLYKGLRGSQQVPCDGLSAEIKPGQNTIRVTVPAACLSRPRWVRMGVAYVVAGANYFVDDAMSDSFDFHTPATLSSRLLT